MKELFDALTTFLTTLLTKVSAADPNVLLMFGVVVLLVLIVVFVVNKLVGLTTAAVNKLG